MKKTLGTDPTYFKSRTGVHGAIEADEEIDIEDVPEENIGDDLSPEQSESIHDAINRAFIAATSPEVAANYQENYFEAKDYEANRHSIEIPKTCYAADQAARTDEARYLEKKHLYAQLKCSSKTSATTAASTLSAGTIYRLGGITVKFNQQQNQ